MPWKTEWDSFRGMDAGLRGRLIDRRSRFSNPRSVVLLKTRFRRLLKARFRAHHHPLGATRDNCECYR